MRVTAGVVAAVALFTVASFPSFSTTRTANTSRSTGIGIGIGGVEAFTTAPLGVGIHFHHPTTTTKTVTSLISLTKKKTTTTTSTRRRNPATSATATSVAMSSSSSRRTYQVGIVGATGAVGKEIRHVLEARSQSRLDNQDTKNQPIMDSPGEPLSISKLRLFGSERSAGRKATMDSPVFGSRIPVELFSVDAARQCDVVFLAVSGDFAKQYARALTAGPDGCVVIDNSSAFRYDADVPLIVPEINGALTGQFCLNHPNNNKNNTNKLLVANPNCTTAIGLMALWPLHQAFTLKKILMSTYQAASGAGQPGMDELLAGTAHAVQSYNHNHNHNNNKEEEKTPTTTTTTTTTMIPNHINKVFAHPLPFNVIPHIDAFQENGYTKEEMKVVWESRKICGLPDDFPVSCTAVRIPTVRAHCESIVVETDRPVDVWAARRVLAKAPGVKLVDDPTQLLYPMPLTATGQYPVEVGRVRQSLIFGEYGLELFVCGDQLLRGAALNAVLVAEVMASNGALVGSTSNVQEQEQLN